MIAHCRFPSDIPSACCADGSAMFTIVPSRTTSSCAALTTASVHHRRPDTRPRPSPGASTALAVT
ncbi:hypothetical protein AB0C87_42315 [Actinomadura sp. NPDC048021]|uniref:hypothetical protein n=1 Tax=Actinomadura sp. NPDC048021 TaxID=3155385 RepID=UPI00340B03BA